MSYRECVSAYTGLDGRPGSASTGRTSPTWTRIGPVHRCSRPHSRRTTSLVWSRVRHQAVSEDFSIIILSPPSAGEYEIAWSGSYAGESLHSHDGHHRRPKPQGDRDATKQLHGTLSGQPSRERRLVVLRQRSFFGYLVEHGARARCGGITSRLAIAARRRVDELFAVCLSVFVFEPTSRGTGGKKQVRRPAPRVAVGQVMSGSRTLTRTGSPTSGSTG